MSYITSMRYLISLYNNQLHEEDVIDMIIDGLRSEIAKDVLLQHPNTITELIAVATRIEQVVRRFDSEDKIFQIESGETRNDLENKIDDLTTRMDEINKKCWNCGVIGHISAKCQHYTVNNVSKPEPEDEYFEEDYSIFY